MISNMFQDHHLVHPSQYQPSTQEACSQLPYPRQSKENPHQSSFAVSGYHQQLPMERGQGLTDPEYPLSYDPYDAFFSYIDQDHGIRHQVQSHCPIRSPYASSQDFHQADQVTEERDHFRAQSHFEKIPDFSSSTTQAFSHHPLPEETFPYGSEVPLFAADQSFDLTRNFSDFANVNELNTANPWWYPNFDTQWNNLQAMGLDAGAAGLLQINSEAALDSQLGGHQAYSYDHTEAGQQPYLGRPLQSSPELMQMNFDGGQVTRYVPDNRWLTELLHLTPVHRLTASLSRQHPDFGYVDKLGRATPFLAPPSENLVSPLEQANFNWAIKFDDDVSDSLEDHVPQHRWDYRNISSDASATYSTMGESSSSESEHSLVPVQIPQPQHEISPSNTSSPGNLADDHLPTEKASTSRVSSDGSLVHKPFHGPIKQNAVAIPRSIPRPARVKVHILCARVGCTKRVNRISDLDRHEKTQHRRGNRGFRCVLCPPNRGRVFSVTYNLRA